MTKLPITFIATLILLNQGIFAQQTPGEKQTTPVTIVGATAHLGNGEVIDESVIVFAEGKIIEVRSASSSEDHHQGKIIDATGKHIYPGFIAPNSLLGLVEISSVEESDDSGERGQMLPHIKSLIAYNPDSKMVESMRPNGVLMGQITPKGGVISGTSSIVQFDAWNWEDAVIKEDDGLHINWPNSFTSGRGENGRVQFNKNYAQEVLELAQYFAAARAYNLGDKETKHLPFESMKTVFTGAKKVFVHVEREMEILDVIRFKIENDLKETVLVGASDAYKVMDDIKKHSIPVIVHRSHLQPNKDEDDYDFPYKNAKILTDGGVLVALQTKGKMETMNTRNLPFYAGTVAATGMDKEEALKLITSNTAKILGIDDKVGTLENGKDATFFISEGDALDMRGNILIKAWIQGREINLESHHTQLYDRYSKK